MKGLSIKEYMEKEGLTSRTTIYNWIDKGYLEFYRTVSGRIRITGEKKRIG